MIIIDKNAKREVQVKYPDRTRVLFPNLDDGYISSNDIVIPNIDAPISDGGVVEAYINDGAEGGVISKLVIGIEPGQDLHGQSNPYPPGGGKNLLNVTATTQTVSGVTFTVNSDGSIKANGTATANIDFTVGTYTLKAGTAIKYNGSTGGSSSTYWIVYSGYQKAGNGDGTADRTASETDWADAPLYIGIANGTTVTNKMFYPMIRLASVADDTFAPYENICPISGWSEAKVTRAGKNLVTKVLDHSNIGGTGVIDGGANDFRLYVGAVKKGETYTITTDEGGGFVGGFFTSDPVAGSTTYNGSRIVQASKTITAPITGYMVFRSSASYATGQIDLGSSATTYESPNSNQYTIDLDGTRYGGTLDVTTGVLTVTDVNIASYNGETLPSTWISDRDVYASGTTPTTGAQVVYKLATPTTVQLTPQEITTLLGNNTIFADCGNILELSYSANMNIRLQDLLNEKLDKPTTPGTLGQVLTSDGEGSQTWETPE